MNSRALARVCAAPPCPSCPGAPPHIPTFAKGDPCLPLAACGMMTRVLGCLPVEVKSVSGSKSGILILVSSGVALIAYFALHLQQLDLIFRWLLGNQ